MDNGQENITDRLIDELYNISLSRLPDEVVEEAKNCLLDYLGVTFVGAQMLGAKTEKLLDPDNGTTTVIGTGLKASPYSAALVNGMHSHVAELDDGERFGMFHPGAPILSALLSIAQEKGITGSDFLRGVIVGYEAAIRLASALQPGLKDRGFHATGVCGTVGAAIGVGVALGFSKTQLKDTLSAAASNASGILSVIKDVSELKPYNVGRAAQNGLSAAMLSQTGLRGPDDVLGGKLGFLSIFSDDIKINRLLNQGDGQYRIQGVYRKPYAACRHCHSAIEGAILLKEQFGLNINNIKSANVNTYFWAVGGHDHTEIKGVNSAKMSIPYSVAVALATGKAGLVEFSEKYVFDEEIGELTKKITVKVDDEMTRSVPQKRAAKVVVEMINGQIFSKQINLPKGEPETPLSDQELINKFIALARYAGKDDIVIQQIINIVRNIEAKHENLYPLL